MSSKTELRDEIKALKEKARRGESDRVKLRRRILELEKENRELTRET